MTMVSMKVVLSDPAREMYAAPEDVPPQEVELSPFSQGVVAGLYLGEIVLYDVASGREIAEQHGIDKGWVSSAGDKRSVYRRAFIQTYPSDSPTHIGDDWRETYRAVVDDARKISVCINQATERRLRLMAEEVDAQMPTDERFERNEGGAFTDATLEHVINACIWRGLDEDECDRGVEARPDGRVVPLDDEQHSADESSIRADQTRRISAFLREPNKHGLLDWASVAAVVDREFGDGDA